MIQDWFDGVREWMAARKQKAAQRLAQLGRRRMEQRDAWRRSIGRPWVESVCWWCLAVIGAVIAAIASVFR